MAWDAVTELAREVCLRSPTGSPTELAKELVRRSGGSLTLEQARCRIRRQRTSSATPRRTRALREATPKATDEHVTKRHDGDTLEARSVSRKIKTVEDLLAHIEADLTRYEVASSEATKWEVATAGDDGEPIVTELFRVFVKLKPKAGPGVKECVEAMLKAASGSVKRPKVARHKPVKRDTFAVINVADPHFGKYAWRPGTGFGDYDLDIAARRLHDASESLIESVARYKPERILVAYLGDLFHADNPGLTTTGGTPLAGSTDGRLQKMLEVGSDSLLWVPERAAKVANVDTLLVNGNHDETLSWAFQRIMIERFRRDARVAVSREFTGRQYTTYGKNLLGFTHGHRAKKKLPQLMAIERPDDWSRCPYREWHTAHLHHQAAEANAPIQTVDAVVVRTAPSLSTPDDYHATNGWVGQREAMEAFIYDAAGGLAAMHVSGPRMKSA